MSPKYEHFVRTVSDNPDIGCGQAIACVMKLSAYTADPNEVSVWWNQYQALKKALQMRGLMHPCPRPVSP